MMNETPLHCELKEVGKSMLSDMGFLSNEIIEEYRVVLPMGLRVIVDVAGISQKRKVAIECGKTSLKKLELMRTEFHDVISLDHNHLIDHYKRKINELSDGSLRKAVIASVPNRRKTAVIKNINELVWTRPSQIVPYSDIEGMLRQNRDTLVFVEGLKKQTAHDAAYRIGRRLGFKVKARHCRWKGVGGYVFFYKA